MARGEGGLRLGTVANGVRGGDGDDWRIAVEVNGGGVEENRAFAGKGFGPDAITHFAVAARFVTGGVGQVDAIEGEEHLAAGKDFEIGEAMTGREDFQRVGIQSWSEFVADEHAERRGVAEVLEAHLVG